MLASLVGLLCVAIAVFAVCYPLGYRYTLIINENIAVHDAVESGGIVYVFKNGEFVGSWENNMTDAGDDAINDRLFNSSWTGAVWNYIAIGTGDGSAENKSRTSLVTEIDRKQAEFYKPTDAQWGLNYTFSFAGDNTITEAGILNAAADGTMAFYVWTLSVSVTSTDTLKISWVGTTSGY